VVPAAGHLARSSPVRIRIPAIGVDSALMGLGLASDGTLQVPPRGFPAGWYTGSPTPGQLGPAVIVGHVDWAGSAGVFYRLHSLRPADRISVVRADGSTAVFQVSRVARYSKQAFPTALVYGDINYAGLRLITCGGSFDRAAHHYVDDVVVFAQLVA
jgi:sortase (surface protein transpeptidase)